MATMTRMTTATLICAEHLTFYAQVVSDKMGQWAVVLHDGWSEHSMLHSTSKTLWCTIRV
jgi:hypothetical protein